MNLLLQETNHFTLTKISQHTKHNNTIYADLVQNQRFYAFHEILTFQRSLAKWYKCATDNDFLKFEKKFFHFSQ